MWQKVAKFKGAEYFLKALYLPYGLYILHFLYLSPPVCVQIQIHVL